MDNNIIINVFHKNWEEIIIIENKLLFTESKPNVKINNFFINEHFLKIVWDNNITDYFLSCDEKNYYYHCDKYYSIFFKNYSYYFICNKYIHKLFLACHSLNICYDLSNIELYYFFDIKNKEFILYDEKNQKSTEYVYFLNKYYDKNYFNENYKQLKIDNDFFNNEIIINKNTSIFYNNLNIIGNYQIFGKYLFLNYLNKNYLYIYNNHIYQNLKIQDNYSLIDEFNFENIKDESNTIIYIVDNIINNNLLYYLNKYFNIYLFDNSKNKINNKIFQNINIIYYKNYDDLNKIKNNLTHKKKIKYYFSNIIDFVLNNKINLNSDKLKFYKLHQLISDNNQNKITVYNNYQKNLKIENPTSISYISNSKIPKIIHFVWIGNNQFPNQYYLFLNSWIDKYPDFTFCFWNEHNLFTLLNQDIFDESITYAQKSDIARYEILYNYGGIYVDADFYSIKNIEELLNNIDIFSGFESDDFIAIGLMGFNKYNRYLKNLILYIELNYHLNKNNNIPNQTGPVYFTNFYKNYIKNYKNYKFFEPSYFYNYSFQDKNNKLPIIFNENNYCYHNWGYSWDLSKNHTRFCYYYLLKYIFNYQINSNLSPQKNELTNLNDLSKYYQNIIFYSKNNSKNEKINIINIIGYFFTGGIEKYIIDLDKYGNHSKYNYILLYLNKKQYNLKPSLKNFTYYSFYDNYELINLINILEPDLIIDHYSQYIDDNIYYYKIYNHITIHIIHSAINYNKSIEYLHIKNCIHLYDEENKHYSWNNIQNNYFNSLGVKLHNKEYLKKIYKQKINCIKQNKCIIIAIIGRVVDEKIPIQLFEKLCKLSLNVKNICIQIYGSLNNIFNSNYNSKFYTLLNNSNIEFYGHIEYDEIYKIYEKIDYLLIPSKFETGSYTCLEALSYGVPVIARNNYGLKKIIKNNISGYLCEGDHDIINKIKYLYQDNLNHNFSIIHNESLKYNIYDKIQNIENIIDKHISKNNLVIVTSVLNISKKELSYYPIRSKFDINDRFSQTKKTIESIKKFIPNCFILFSECSDLKNYKYMENYIKSNVDIFINHFDDIDVKNDIESIHKGLGEKSLMLKSINYINSNNLIFDNVFKISGRYYLNNNFNYEDFNNTNNQFAIWDNNFKSYATLFYKIKFKYLELLNECFINADEKLRLGAGLELILCEYFNKYMNFKNITILNKLNIDGYLSTEGFFFTT